MTEQQAIEWTNWEGGKRPVPKNWTVEVMSRDSALGTVIMFADQLTWEHSGARDDIVAYRVLESN